MPNIKKPSKKRRSRAHVTSPEPIPVLKFTPAAPTTETIAHTIYDTFTLLPEDEREYIYLFMVPLGQEKKTEVDTNMLCGGMLPFPQSFRADSLYLDFLNYPSVEDKRQFLRSYSFDLLIGAKPYFQCLATDLCPEEMGTNAFRTTPARAFSIHAGHHFYARFKRQYLAPLDRYGKGIRARIALNGWLTRSLQ